ncbi:hypothetical protein CBR_g29924 [Chara braunii]|uniref:Response regulatory domain-containing protein n=1 Tax=Chara braunii TaxID=69332 RepID=A0A388JWZ5_CHABU|nr:hypothetical protein CBR_g29924 [Chara braunii]|eukprot:GBG62316.1 hypothetical protein CBR_g29924 [Chara braunii]
MGGFLTFDSHPGVGTTFTFSVRVLKADSATQEGITAELSSPEDDGFASFAMQRLRGLKALVVDNRNVRREVTASYLRRIGMRVEPASTASEAVKMIAASLSLRHDRDGLRSTAGLAGVGGEQQCAVHPPPPPHTGDRLGNWPCDPTTGRPWRIDSGGNANTDQNRERNGDANRNGKRSRNRSGLEGFKHRNANKNRDVNGNINSNRVADIIIPEGAEQPRGDLASRVSGQQCTNEGSVATDERFSVVLVADSEERDLDWIWFIKQAEEELATTSREWASLSSPAAAAPRLPPMIVLLGGYNKMMEARACDLGFAGCVGRPMRRTPLLKALFQAQNVLGGEGADGAANPAQPLVGLPVQKVGALKSLLRGKRFLVVDDNRVNLKVASRLLEKCGAEASCAASGHEAIRLLEIPHNIDIVLMDVQMPDLDGFETTRRIRQMEREACLQEKNSVQHTVIVAITADVLKGTREKCIESGMDGYVTKPIHEDQLLRIVAKFLGKKSGASCEIEEMS